MKLDKIICAKEYFDERTYVSFIERLFSFIDF
jgi:hypothetical protein